MMRTLAEQLRFHPARTSLQRRAVAAGAAVLTFDDGPGPRLTPRLLDVLAAHDVRATFFPLGRRAEQHPETLDRVAEQGHEIGTHSYDHLNAWKHWPGHTAADVKRGFDVMHPWLSNTKLFRPPHGKLNPWSSRAARQRGGRVALWTLDSCDTHVRLPAPESVGSRLEEDGGGVILFHDHDRGRDREEFVLRATATVMTTAKACGMVMMTFGDLLQHCGNCE